LNQRRSPPLRLPVSDCSTVRIVCDVPSIPCSVVSLCFPRVASEYFFQPFITIPVSLIVTGIITHFMFLIHCISIHDLLYFSFFSASFCTTFLSAGNASSISMHVFSFLLLIIISGRFAVTFLSVCTASFYNTITLSWSYNGLGVRACRVCVCIPFVCRFEAYGFAYWVMQMCTKFIMSH
jgi:hypothetical protein